VVLQEVFGINSHIRKMTDAFAAQGFIAVAPCLFDRVQKGVELGYDEASVAQGLDFVKQVGLEHPMADIQATVSAFSGEGKVALVGYDWGGYLAYNAANRVQGLATVVAYYGCGIVNDFSQRRKIPTLLHFGTLDPYIPLNQLIIFRGSRPDLRIYDYPAGHHFNCDERDTYDAAATDKAWTTTLLHLTHRLEGPPVVTLKNQGAYAATGGKDKEKKKPAAVSDDMGPPM
jgi:carboxymethylenebutenolidase